MFDTEWVVPRHAFFQPSGHYGYYRSSEATSPSSKGTEIDTRVSIRGLQNHHLQDISVSALWVDIPIP